MKRLQLYLPALGIFCLALLVRIVYNLTVARNYVAGYDSQAYEKIAVHMLQEHCFCLDPHLPTAGWVPVWPGVIAIVYALAGPRNFFVRLFLCFIGSGTCALVYLWAKGIFSKRIALVAGIIAALYPDSSSMMVGCIPNPCIPSSFWLSLTPCILYSVPQNAAG